MNSIHALRVGAALLLTAAFAPVATAPASAVGETCDGRTATLVVPAPSPDMWDVPTFTGTPGNDVIVGSAERDVIDGAGGDDVLCGLAGNDELFGGEGDDRLFGGLDGDYWVDEGYYGDLIEPGPGDDYVDLGHDPRAEDVWSLESETSWDMISFSHAAGPVTVDLAAGTATGEGTDTIAAIVFAAGIVGSAHDDHLRGTDLKDLIVPGGGDDTVDARGGNDEVAAEGPGSEPGVGAGEDVILGGAGHDQFWIGDGAHLVAGGDGRDLIYVRWGAGADLRGDGGPDVIHGGGAARIDGGAGADHLEATITDLSEPASIDGGPGRDVLSLGLSKRVAPVGAHLVVGAPAGIARIAGRGVVTRFTSMQGFDASSASFPEWLNVTWYGTARADRLDLEMYLGGWIRAYGRGGDDWLRTGYGRDHLDGGPGRDHLLGGPRRDRCVHGERLASCEVRR
jgi:Ca2+-binding RTX toxin-like protein